MTQEEKTMELAGLFEVDTLALKPETALDTLNWDSMTRVALIGLVKELCGKTLTVDVLRGLKTVGDVLAAMDA